MSQPNFYEIIGVPPSASNEEIRAAHRELVKRYHPDIYSTSGDKARATEKLQAINEAYAVLGNAERRKDYDASRMQQARRPQTAAQPRPPHVRRVKSSPRPKAAPRRVQARKKFDWKKKFLTFPRFAGIVAGVILFTMMVYILNGEPEITPIWILVQKNDVEPAPRESSTSRMGWEQLGAFGVRAECARILKTHVTADQAQGSQAVLDESNGTMAITVLLSESDPTMSAKEPTTGQKNITKRVRHYECRMVQARQADSWLRRKMHQIGFLR